MSVNIPLDKYHIIRKCMRHSWENRDSMFINAEEKIVRGLVMKTLFDNAKSTITFFCEKFVEHSFWMSPSFSDNLKNAVARGVKIKIYSKDSDEKWNKTEEGYTFRELDTTISCAGIQFIVADCRAFLYESTTQKPIANIYHPLLAANLIYKSDTAYNRGKLKKFLREPVK